VGHLGKPFEKLAILADLSAAYNTPATVDELLYTDLPGAVCVRVRPLLCSAGVGERSEMSDAVKVLNQSKWGVCGFVSILNAMAHNKKLAAFYGVTIDGMQDQLAPELITWLKITNVEKPEMVRDILVFCKEFGRNYNTVDDLVRVIKQEFLAGAARDPQRMTAALDIAMPPHCLVQYLRDVYRVMNVSITHFYHKALSRSELTALKDSIVGVGGSIATKPYDHLLHWVYVDEKGGLWNWGNYDNLASSASDNNALLRHPSLTSITCRIKVL